MNSNLKASQDAFSVCRIFDIILAMDDLLKKIENTKRSSVGSVIDARIKQFKEVGRNSNDKIFKELCFCLLTANSDAERAIKIQNQI